MKAAPKIEDNPKTKFNHKNKGVLKDKEDHKYEDNSKNVEDHSNKTAPKIWTH